MLDPARERAETRVQAFLDAALELMSGSSGQEFTVQEVIERSGQSLRSFYQYFDGKYELLLALFEDAVRTTAPSCARRSQESRSPLDKLHRFAIDYYRVCQPTAEGARRKKGFAPAFASFAQQLLTEHPQEASQAFIPLTEMLDGLLDEAAAAGAIRAGLRHTASPASSCRPPCSTRSPRRSAAYRCSRAIADPADELWELLINGIASETRCARPSSVLRPGPRSASATAALPTFTRSISPPTS